MPTVPQQERCVMQPTRTCLQAAPIETVAEAPQALDAFRGKVECQTGDLTSYLDGLKLQMLQTSTPNLYWTQKVEEADLGQAAQMVEMCPG